VRTALALRSGEEVSVATTPAGKLPAKRHKLRTMPRWLRTVLTAWCFAWFFGGTCVLGVFAGLYYRLRRIKDEERWGFTRKINRRLALFAGFMRDQGLIDYWPPQVPAGYEDRGFLLIANHPTLIDVVLLLSSIPQLSCVVKASWYRSFLMGPMLRQMEYIPGPGHEEEEGDTAPVVARMEQKLKGGVPLLVFPEGTRSARDNLRRFRRGSIEAAVRAGAPILPLFIGCDQPDMLSKGVPFYRVPRETPGFVFEWLPPIETVGKDSRTLTRELTAQYEARFARHVAEKWGT
jgi:1-acyl-sn-glycerol-3-phosphate acyltransferase